PCGHHLDLHGGLGRPVSILADHPSMHLLGHVADRGDLADRIEILDGCDGSRCRRRGFRQRLVPDPWRLDTGLGSRPHSHWTTPKDGGCISASRADPCCSAEESNRKPTGSSEFLCALQHEGANAVLTAGAYFQRRTWRNGRFGPGTRPRCASSQWARAMSFSAGTLTISCRWMAPICAVAAFFIKDCLAHPPFVVFIHPFLLIFSILAQSFFRQAQLFTPKKLDQWLTRTLLTQTCARPQWHGLAGRRCPGARPFRQPPSVSTVSMRPNPRRSWKASACTGVQSG